MLCIIFLLFMIISNCQPNRNSSTLRDIRSTSRYTLEKKKAIVDLHNQYRDSVDPPASDMMFMQWNDDCEEAAQYLADTCSQDHGFPPGNKYQGMGQNMYFGLESSGIQAITLWYEEFKYYNYNDQSCQDKQQCGHYTQVAWASSKFVGCGYASCPSGYTHVVCNYKPGGNVFIQGKAMKPYKEGAACTQCQSVDGGLCTSKLCVTKDICKKNSSLNCECKIECYNCGKMKKEGSCACRCADGWDGLTCQNICANENNQCKMMYLRLPCSDTYKNQCREKCQMCKRADPKKPENLCCDGKVCEKGFLNEKSCECEDVKTQPTRSLAPPSDISWICLLLWLIVSIQTGL